LNYSEGFWTQASDIFLLTKNFRDFRTEVNRNGSIFASILVIFQGFEQKQPDIHPRCTVLETQSRNRET
jgi:hypothetical protein